MPRLLWLGSLILCLPALLVRLWLALEPDMEPGRVFTTDIYVASLVILYWTVLLTAGIAAFISWS